MKSDKKLKLDLRRKSSTKKRNELTWEASKNQNKRRPCPFLADKKTGTEITSLLWKKGYFTVDMNG